ncbi:LuxR C-terminal-related transcriptional regulator [Microbacterium deminutum]|uniref:LuxR C-terminal-related transcriptional regulator n=1 Tax=Microbacterium deminutum TaxID=344164 RepID=A0ABN2R1J3_9MICO
MTGPTPEPGVDPFDLDRSLLDAKLSVPLLRRDFVSRVETVERARTSGARVVAVSAPAGYGKTSLLVEWAATEDRAVAWVLLDRFDDDPVGLLSLLASAFVRATGADPTVVPDMRVHALATLGRAAPRLAAVLRTSEKPFMFMVDDLHLLTSPACHDVLSVVLAGVPEGSQFVGASRTSQPYVPSHRAIGDVLEIGVEDLAMDSAAAQQIFRHAKVELSATMAQAVIERTEGWPVGLHLAAMIAHDTKDAAAVISGEDRYVADYLYGESFSALPEAVRRFLRRTSILDNLTEELCLAVIGEAGPGGRLRELEASNVFLIPQDRTREWYRYHPLYREFLLGELRREEPDIIPELHARAAAWFESRRTPAMAIEHLLQTPDRGHCALLIDSLGLMTYQTGEMATLQRWLASLGDERIEAYPPLAVLSGWMAVLSGHSAEADRWARIADAAIFDGVPADGTASFPSTRAMLRAAMCAGGPEQMLADAELAFAVEPPWSPWRPLAVSLVGEAHLLDGRPDDAAPYFIEAAQLGAATGNVDVQARCNTHLAMMAMARGQWERGSELIHATLTLIEEHRLEDYATTLLSFAAAARLSLQRGDTRAAERELTRAMRARPVSTWVLPTVAVRLRIHLATTYWAMGDASTARHLVREIEDVLLHRPALGALVEQFAALRDLVTTTAAGGTGGPPLTPAELRLLPYLQTHLTLPEIGARLFVSRNTVGTEVSSIYRKLGATSRSEAVELATTLGLLGA